MAYPSSIDAPGGTAAQGTSLLTSPDHSQDHRIIGSAVISLENKVGIGSGSAAVNQALIGSGAGTSSWTSTWNNATLGTPTIGTGLFTGGTVNSAVMGSPSITSGTANGITLGTPVIGTVSIPGTVTALGFSAAIAPGVGSVADSAGGTLTVNAQAGQVYYSVMGTAAGNRTIGTPLNPTGYQQLTYAFKASGSSNATIVWPSGAFVFSQDTGTPAIGTGTSWNYFGWRYNAIDSKWQFMGQSKNII